MSFSEWKKRSKLYQSFKARADNYGIGYEEVAQAAYKAGERDGKMQEKDAATRAIAAIEEIMRSNVK